jgi:hypothetical protein
VTTSCGENTGHAVSTTSVVITHPDAGGTTAGTTVVATMYLSTATTVTAPAGCAKINTSASLPVYAKSNGDGCAVQTVVKDGSEPVIFVLRAALRRDLADETSSPIRRQPWLSHGGRVWSI